MSETKSLGIGSEEKQPLISGGQSHKDVESGSSGKKAASFFGVGMTTAIILYYAACSSTMVRVWVVVVLSTRSPRLPPGLDKACPELSDAQYENCIGICRG